jgi:hypothetical protein
MDNPMMNTYKRHRFPPKKPQQPSGSPDQSSANTLSSLYGNPEKITRRLFQGCHIKGGSTPTEKETPVTHDDPDALDANVVFAGLGVDGLASGASGLIDTFFCEMGQSNPMSQPGFASEVCESSNQ